MGSSYDWPKRALDRVASGIGLTVLAVPGAALALWIKLDSPGPVFFKGLRIGRNAQPFYIYKFRTMIADAAARGAGITVRDDPRITRAGRFLRRTKLDELPQLWNVWRGEMSLVGPRPEDPRYLCYYDPVQRGVLAVPPGITGVASLAFRDEQALLSGPEWDRTYVDLILPKKLDLELDYLERRTFWSDLRILAGTLLGLLSGGKGPHAS